MSQMGALRHDGPIPPDDSGGSRVAADGLADVLVVGSDAAGDALERVGARPRRAPTMPALLDEPNLRRARAIVVHHRALGDAPLATTLRQVSRRCPLGEILIWAPAATPEFVRDALRAGARDVILSPTATVLASAVEEALDQGARTSRTRPTGTRFEGLVSRSTRMWDIFDLCDRVARTDATVLILGETGTGKELIARAVHRRSNRAGRFVAVNCGAVPEGLLDSELFGHVKGTFTGATRDKGGLFTHAHGGTLFLDEIGNIPLAAQSRLLRALQEGAIRPVGGADEVAVDVRVIAATSSSLEANVASGQFREDLFYRLDVFRLIVPPLRERPEDLLFLFAYFAKKVALRHKLARPEVSDDFLEALVAYDWPGNVRQLENFTERLVLSHASERVTGRTFRRLQRPFLRQRRSGRLAGRTVSAATVPPPSAAPATPTERTDPADPTIGATLADSLDRAERAYLTACLRRHGGRVDKTAEQAGINRRTLLRKMRKHGLEKRRFRPGAASADPDARDATPDGPAG